MGVRGRPGRPPHGEPPMTDEPRATREDPGPLLARTAEIATAYLRGIARPAGPRRPGRRLAPRGAADGPAGDRRGSDRGHRAARQRRGPGHRLDGGTALLRLRHRRQRPGLGRGRLADLDLGPERGAVLVRPGRIRRRGGRGCVAHRPARPAGRHQLRPGLGLPDGALHGLGRRAPCGPRGRRLGRRGEGPHRGARDRRRRRWRGAFDHRRGAAVPRPRPRPGPHGGRGRAGPDAARRPRGDAGRHPGRPAR